MLTIIGHRNGTCCDGVRRRDFLKAGAMGLGFAGMNLADLLRAESANGQGSSCKSIINIHLGGGPSHQDMFDLKPDAPVEYRGEFNPTSTNVPGLEICDLMPRLAKIGDKFSLVRGLIGSVNEHSTSTTQTGYRQKAMPEIGGPPAVGSVISKLQGFNQGVAPFVLTFEVKPGFLGPKFKSFDTNRAQRMLKLERISADRLSKRSDLLKGIDNLRRDADATGQFNAADAFARQAVEVVLSGKMAAALNPSEQADADMKRYTGSGQRSYRSNRDFLMARRLVEAGVRCISLRWGSWDTHGGNFTKLREQLPALDVGLSCLIQDLCDRGMHEDVVIAVWGEFGRTPRVNGGAGRDHWPRVAACFLSGGIVKGGRVVGASDRIAGDAESPVHVHQVLATLYQSVGIDPRTTQIVDPAGRPRYLLDEREPIRELL